MVKRILLLPLILAALLSSGFNLMVESPEDGVYPLYLPQIFIRPAGSLPQPEPTAQPTAAVPAHPGVPADFIGSVVNGQSGVLVGAYVPGKLALPVIQQPQGQEGYVSEQRGVVTQFTPAAEYGTVGLLAHNYLSGELFFDLVLADDVALVYGDGLLDYYRVTAIYRYQALDPTNPYSDFIDMEDPSQRRVSSSDVFQRVYAPSGRLVFQTCIQANGDASWGRLFVIAEPVQ